MNDYQWKDGSRVPKSVTANAAAAEFERIRSKGPLTPKAIVDASRPKAAVLHPAFEWNDKRAAEQWRENQASSMVRAVVVVPKDDETPPHREYVLVNQPIVTAATDSRPARQETHYMRSEVVVQHVDLFADALGKLEARVRETQSSVRELETLATRDSNDPERIMRIAMAVKAIDTAAAAIAGLH